MCILQALPEGEKDPLSPYKSGCNEWRGKGKRSPRAATTKENKRKERKENKETVVFAIPALDNKLLKNTFVENSPPKKVRLAVSKKAYAMQI